jgi:hypothetical protein
MSARRRKEAVPTYTNLAEYRAALDAAKIVAMNNFERDWGTRDVGVVANALRATADQATGYADWAAKARASL